MDWLRLCIEALRALAKEPQGNRLPLAELQVNEFVQHQVDDLRKALEGLRNAVKVEATTKPSESAFWNSWSAACPRHADITKITAGLHA
jgi:hypothetical protein